MVSKHFCPYVANSCYIYIPHALYLPLLGCHKGHTIVVGYSIILCQPQS